MIEVYKILTGKYDPTLPGILHRNIKSTTSGNPLKLCIYRPKYGVCKYNFTVRVISLWNSLPTHMITADSVDSFKYRLQYTSFGQMRKHILTTRPTYLAAVLQEASKSYVAFLGRLPKVDLIILEGKNVRPSVRPQKVFFDLNEIWYVGRGR